MNDAVELHDSRVDDIAQVEADLRVVFRPAYVHRSDGRPGSDSGWGYLQPVEFLFRDANYSEVGDCRGRVSDGAVSSGRVQYPNLVPMPLAVAGTVTAELTFVSGGVLRVSARGFSCTAIGEPDPNFRERYEG